MTSTPRAFIALTVLVATGCGRALSPGEAPPDAATVGESDAAVVTPPATTCADVSASCSASTQLVVHGHASGLVGLEGARAEFAVRFAGPPREASIGANGVAAARTEVRGGAFEACVCLSRESADSYPLIAAVVFRPGTTGETSADVARATLSQRYATLGDENLSGALTDPAPPIETEAALAAMVQREALFSVHDLDPALEGRQIYAGLVADVRPIAADLAIVTVSGGAVQFDWVMPGQPWPDERVALYVDVDGDRRCTSADRGGTTPFVAGGDVASGAIRWVSGAALEDLCRTAALDTGRGW